MENNGFNIRDLIGSVWTSKKDKEGPALRVLTSYDGYVLMGSSGTSGVDGVDGANGTTGTSGVSGLSGTSGSSGIRGFQGIQGSQGFDGWDGTSGTSGISIKGDGGTSGVSGLSGTSGSSGSVNVPSYLLVDDQGFSFHDLRTGFTNEYVLDIEPSYVYTLDDLIFRSDGHLLIDVLIGSNVVLSGLEVFSTKVKYHSSSLVNDELKLRVLCLEGSYLVGKLKNKIIG